MRLRYIALALVLCGGLYLAGKSLRLLDGVWRAPGPLETEKLVWFPPGSGGKAVALKLEENGVIRHAWSFRILARINHVNGALKAGEYKFTPHMPVADVIELLQSGKTYQRRLTVAEGLTATEIAALVNEAEAMTGTAGTAPEGSLLPETYSYSYGDARGDLIARMQQSMADTLDELWSARDPAVPLSSPAEAVTLASVVEKETGVAAERPRIAGVFYNRLKARMPLQSDPTVAYAVTRGLAKLGHGLTRSELATPSPYNTYLNAGLPPGPIANPGRAALEAVLHPEKNDFIYFVADGTGGHVFAATLAAHNKNVAGWRKIENKQKSAP